MFAIFGAGPWELLIVAGIILLLFGNRLPGVMRSMGRGIMEFKKGVREGEEGIGEDAPEQIERGAGETADYSAGKKKVET